MQLDKIKGTLVDFNQLEHVLDDAPNIGAWQLEIQKFNNDPMELDELVLHVQKLGEVSEEKLSREINSRFLERTEIRPNRIVYHELEEMRHLLGVGTQMKELKVLDRRPKIGSRETSSAANLPPGVTNGLSPLSPASLVSAPSNHVEVKS